MNSTDLINKIKVAQSSVLGVECLDEISSTELAQIFAAIPKIVTTLNLNDNYFGDIPSEELTPTFAAIPETVTVLGLSATCVGKKLVLIITGLRKTVTTLYLDRNELGFEGSHEELTQIFAVIPETVTTLGLSYNYLDNIPSEKLAQTFATLPKTVTTLDLGNNHLSERESLTLIQTLSNLPSGIINLDLSDNALGEKNTHEVIEILNSIPPHVRFINLSGNQLFTKRTLAERDALLKGLKDPERFNFKNNGESDLDRAAAPMISLARSGKVNLPTDMVVHILSFFSDKEKEKGHAAYVYNQIEMNLPVASHGVSEEE